MSRNRKAKHSKASLYPLFDNYAKNEESRTSFCERHGIGLHNYNYWWAKYRKEKGLSDVSKNKGRKKNTPESSPSSICSTPISITNSAATLSPATGTFIKMEAYVPSKDGILTLRTHQGIELKFEQLPPVGYLQQLLNLGQNS